MTPLEMAAYEIWENLITQYKKPGDVITILANMVAWTAFAGSNSGTCHDMNRVIDLTCEQAKVLAAMNFINYQSELRRQ
jgi:hypothetical protein